MSLTTSRHTFSGSPTSASPTIRSLSNGTPGACCSPCTHDHISGWIARADELLNDDDIARLYIDIHQARSLLPDDSRIAQLAGRAAQLSQRHARQQNSTLDMKHDADAFRLVSDHGLALSPAWLRLTELGLEALTRT